MSTISQSTVVQAKVSFNPCNPYIYAEVSDTPAIQTPAQPASKQPAPKSVTPTIPPTPIYTLIPLVENHPLRDLQRKVEAGRFLARTLSAQSTNSLSSEAVLDPEGGFLLVSQEEAKGRCTATLYNENFSKRFSVDIPIDSKSPQMLDGKIFFMDKNAKTGSCYAPNGSCKDFSFLRGLSYFGNYFCYKLDTVLCLFKRSPHSRDSVTIEIIGSDKNVRNTFSLDIKPEDVASLKFVPSKGDRFVIHNQETKKLYLCSTKGIEMSLVHSFEIVDSKFCCLPLSIGLVGGKILFLNGRNIHVITLHQGAQSHTSTETIANCFPIGYNRYPFTIYELDNELVCLHGQTGYADEHVFQATQDFTIFNINDLSRERISFSTPGYNDSTYSSDKFEIIGVAQVMPNLYALASKKAISFYVKDKLLSQVNCSDIGLKSISQIKATSENKLLVVGEEREGVHKVIELSLPSGEVKTK